MFTNLFQASVFNVWVTPEDGTVTNVCLAFTEIHFQDNAKVFRLIYLSNLTVFLLILYFYDNLSTPSSLYANFCLLDSKVKSHTDFAKCLYKNLHGLVENETFW